VTVDPARPGLGILEDGALVVSGGRIQWVGPVEELRDTEFSGVEDRIDLDGRLLTPGLIDCHTHLVFGGNRAGEFRRRLEGATYEQIAREGGGILSTVRATREASEADLLGGAVTRMRDLAAAGVTTVEVKSGYGLDLATELKMLRVARQAGERAGLRVRTTLLAAHALPPEFSRDRAGYLELVVEEILPAVVREGLADAVDAFCEGIAFSVEECARVFEAARATGLRIRLHADQLSDGGGAALAARFGAASADHLEYTSLDGVSAMAGAGTVAVLLPGAFYFLGEDRSPPIRAFREAGVPMAVATDLNPGSSPLKSLLLAMNQAAVFFGLTEEEIVKGVTRIPAGVLGMDGHAGILAPGAWADLAVWDLEDPVELIYWMGGSPLHASYVGGDPLYSTTSIL
jgi:imidazolonepropionase